MRIKLMLKKILAFFGLAPGGALVLLGGYNAILTLLSQISADFIDFKNFSLVNLFTPFTSVGGSGTFLDYIVAGPGASGGSAIRYWMFMIYAFIAAAGFFIVNTCWQVLTKKNANDS
jgi:hypothetical protein